MRYHLLEPLRGLAALWVFAYHYDFSTTFQVAAPFLHAVCKLGHLGVPMFFVISGYCILGSARSALRKNEPSRSFLYRRARRIYPTYWAAVAVAAAVPFVLAAMTAVKSGRYTAPTAADPGAGFLGYGPADWAEVVTLTRVFDAAAGPDSLQQRFTALNAVFWTLAIEVQFYAVVALAVAARRYFYPVLGVVTAASIPAALTPGAETTGFFLPYWPQFALGAGVYLLFERGAAPSRLFGRRAAVIGFTALAVAAAGFVAWVGGGAAGTVTAFAAAFALFAYSAEGLDRLYDEYGLRSRWRLVRAAAGLAAVGGAMSYSIYLIHGRVRFVSMAAVRRVLPADGTAHDLAVIALTVAVCYAFYRVAERPFVGPPPARKPQPPAPTPAAPELSTVG